MSEESEGSESPVLAGLIADNKFVLIDVIGSTVNFAGDDQIGLVVALIGVLGEYAQNNAMTGEEETVMVDSSEYSEPIFGAKSVTLMVNDRAVAMIFGAEFSDIRDIITAPTERNDEH